MVRGVASAAAAERPRDDAAAALCCVCECFVAVPLSCALLVLGERPRGSLLSAQSLLCRQTEACQRTRIRSPSRRSQKRRIGPSRRWQQDNEPEMDSGCQRWTRLQTDESAECKCNHRREAAGTMRRLTLWSWLP